MALNKQEAVLPTANTTEHPYSLAHALQAARAEEREARWKREEAERKLVHSLVREGREDLLKLSSFAVRALLSRGDGY
jgi:hypothetical protein